MAKKAAAQPEPSYASAMDKLRDEMAKSKARYVQVVGEYLTDYLLAHPEAEGAILAAGKSIAGSLEEMKAEARRSTKSNVAILDDATAFGIVLKYYGLKDKQGKKGTGDGAETVKDVAVDNRRYGEDGGGAENPAAETDPFDLDALMGGL